MSSKSLAAAPARMPLTVVAVELDFGTRERLAALGLRTGRRVEVVRRLGRRGPVQVRIDRTDVVLRAHEAALIATEPAA